MLAAFGVPQTIVHVPSVVSASASQWQPDGSRTPAKPLRFGRSTFVPLLLLLQALSPPEIVRTRLPVSFGRFAAMPLSEFSTGSSSTMPLSRDDTALDALAAMVPPTTVIAAPPAECPERAKALGRLAAGSPSFVRAAS